MKEINTIIEMLEKIRTANNKAFDTCSYEKLISDVDYGKLYQAYIQADSRVGNVIDLLMAVEKSMD